MISDDVEAQFRLSDSFINKYKKLQPPFGFNGLGELVFYRTYSRPKADGTNEQFYETIRRVIEGTYRMQERHIKAHGLPWSERKATLSAHEMYDRMFHMKFLPPGRGLWAMGSAITEERHLYAALNSCAFTSTDDLVDDVSEAFEFVMDMSMLGVGVGFDTKGANQITIQKPNGVMPHVIEDTREAWVLSLRVLLRAFFLGEPAPQFDYSKIRGPGLLIKGFGGKSSGPEPLKDLHESLAALLSSQEGLPISSRIITDIMNMIGRCVVAGNVRRTALLALGFSSDEEYLDLKDYSKNPERGAYGWTSNNSIFAELGMDYSTVADRTRINGEPGYVWLENMRGYSRMNTEPDYKDALVQGTNPCFAANTLIAVADGRGAVTIEELAKTGDDVPVYSINESGKVEIKYARYPRKTQENVDLVRITLDDGNFVDVTPDHKMRLLDGSNCLANELKPGDSLPRFTREMHKMSYKGNTQDYLRIKCDTLNGKANKVMEHRLIAKFHQPELWKAMYCQDKKSGWAKGGFVVHHIDGCGTNNRPDNLSLETYSAHSSIHSVEKTGEANGMFGRTHSDSTKALIGKKTQDRWQDETIANKIRQGINKPENKLIYAENMRNNVRARMLNYYTEQEAKTDLDTIWVGDNLLAVKKCESCGVEMILPWSQRFAAFCSRRCVNKNKAHIESRKRGQNLFWEDKLRQTLHEQIMAYKDLEVSLGRDPLKREWESLCRSRKISFRMRTPNSATTNPNALTTFRDLKRRALAYNHRVVSVETLPGKHDVYNLTVDDNHTVGIITDFNGTDKASNGIFTFQCGEQSLFSRECCNLVETFPARHDDYEDFERTLKFAYLYAKTVTLGATHWEKTNAVMLRNRRIGTSQSGIVQAIDKLGMDEYRRWCNDGYNAIQRYDRIYSEWLAVPRSIKTTSVKPSGTVSLLANAYPGVHDPEDRYYIRRVRIAKTSELLGPIIEAGYPVEPGIDDTTVMVVSFPIKIEDTIRTVGEVSMWEKLARAAMLQEVWADNQVSASITFDPATEGQQIEHALNYFQYKIKGVSFLPRLDYGAFPQMPYEAITADQYEVMASALKPLRFGRIEGEEAEVERFCDGGACQIAPTA